MGIVNNMSKGIALILKTLRNNAKRRHILVTISLEEFKLWFNKEHCCFYCGQELAQGLSRRVNTLTVDRIDPKLGYSKDNILMACYRCNRLRSDFYSVGAMVEIAERFIKPKL